MSLQSFSVYSMKRRHAMSQEKNNGQERCYSKFEDIQFHNNQTI